MRGARLLIGAAFLAVPSALKPISPFRVGFCFCEFMRRPAGWPVRMTGQACLHKAPHQPPRRTPRMTDQPNGTEGPDGQKPGSMGELLLGGLLMTAITVVVIGGLFWVVGGGIGWLVEWENPGWGECQERTRAMLLDPASSSFGAPSRATATDDPRVYRYSYTVSAKNAFGGTIQNRFYCVIDPTGPTTTYRVHSGN